MGYQKPNNELKSQIYQHKISKKPIVLKFNVLDVDTRKDIDDEMGYNNDDDQIRRTLE